MLEIRVDTRKLEDKLMRMNKRMLDYFERESTSTMKYIGEVLRSDIIRDYKRPHPEYGKHLPTTNIGMLEGSIAYKITGKMIKKILTIFSPLIYARWVEEGRKKFKPRITELAYWVGRKFKLTGARDKWKIWPIARSLQKKIERRGLKGIWTFKRTLKERKKWIIDQFDALISKTIIIMRP